MKIFLYSGVYCIYKSIYKGIVMDTSPTMTINPQLTKAAGIDIHSRTIIVYYYQHDQPENTQQYGTYTCDLETIRNDLQRYNITDVIMESTGIYWIALCSLLTAAGVHVCVVNPWFIKNMPKEKTDKKDAKWLCKLLVNGLVRNSYLVPEDQRAFRELCRQRTKYTQQIAQSQNRILKHLECRNIKLRSVVSSMHTKSAMEIVQALAQGETDIERLVSLCRGKLTVKQNEMRKALVGVLTNHDRDMLQTLLDDIAHYRRQITKLENAIRHHTETVNKELVANLQTIAGISQRSTEIILAEVGDTVDAFSTPDKLAAWVGLAPGNNESAGKMKYAGRRMGNVYLRSTMIQAAWGAVHTRNSYWRALFNHLNKRLPAKKAIVVIARKLIKVVYKSIKYGRAYTEYGAKAFYERFVPRTSIVLRPIATV